MDGNVKDQGLPLGLVGEHWWRKEQALEVIEGQLRHISPFERIRLLEELLEWQAFLAKPRDEPTKGISNILNHPRLSGQSCPKSFFHLVQYQIRPWTCPDVYFSCKPEANMSQSYPSYALSMQCTC